jgi:NADH-quinone oxidoreductase subunit F
MSDQGRGLPGDMARSLRQALALGSEESIRELERAGLRDRDYENRATAGRMRAHASLADEGKRIVCDCADAEPGLTIGRYLAASEAMAVVAGALIAAFATATRRVVIHVAQDDEPGAAALAEAAAVSGGVGDLAGGGVEVEIARERFRRDMKGYEESATLVLTGETLLHVARILSTGAEEYRRLGTPGSPGTKFFQVSGCVDRPGLHELPLGATLRDIVDGVCGGVRAGETLQSVMVGGCHGACFTDEELDTSVDFDMMRLHGGVIGSGEIAVLSRSDCVIDHVKQRLAASCYELCGACSLGREGSYQLREMISDSTRGRSKGGDLDMLREIGGAMQAAAACPSGRTAANLVLSTMEKFAEEYEAHMRRRLCRGLVCAQYVTFHILPERCDGCGVCLDACPEGAVQGGRQKIHVIDQDLCEKCGTCFEACGGLRQAVVKAGAIKPRTPRTPVPIGTWKA